MRSPQFGIAIDAGGRGSARRLQLFARPIGAWSEQSRRVSLPLIPRPAPLPQIFLGPSHSSCLTGGGQLEISLFFKFPQRGSGCIYVAMRHGCEIGQRATTGQGRFPGSIWGFLGSLKANPKTK